MFKNKKLAVLSAIVVFLSLFMVALVAKPAFAADQNTSRTTVVQLVVRPLTIFNYSAVPGESFEVSINVTALGTINLQGFNISLSYNPAILNCTDVSEGDLFQVGATKLNSTIDYIGGIVVASANITSAGSTVHDNGTLVMLTFQVKGTGETSLHLYDTFLYDSAGADLHPEVYDGYFNNKVNFDITMPLTLFAVTLASLFLFPKLENKLNDMLEEREFRVRDAVLLVVMMAVMISIIVIVRELSTILMVLFLFSYSLLLFTFGYVLSKNRWYVGIVSPVIFILLYVFLRNTSVWTYYLSNVYGLVFAVMITLYLADLFNWKTTAVFGVLLTGMDIVLVLVTKTMVQAASTAVSLNLPVLVSLPLIPLITTGTGIFELSLGLGDFFFAGLLAIQTFKKYGRNVAILSVVGMTISFALFETYLLTYRIGAFPGTLMIICGWMPVPIAQTLRSWRKNRQVGSEKMLSS